MRFLSVCSGIEAASVAWQPLGWKAWAFSEIEPFPCAVLAHHYPNVPNLGDMTKFKDWPDATLDLLCGGTPCQSFSVAGLRAGLADPRGNLMLTYLAIAAKYRPQWVVWENVPGVLSSWSSDQPPSDLVEGQEWEAVETSDFGSFLAGLGELGYGYAYRVLDAQYFGVPQRRRRLFVVGCLGDWRSAAAVLFERHSLSGHPAPRRQAGQRPAGTLSAHTEGGGGLGTDFELGGGLIAGTLQAAGKAAGSATQQDAESGLLIAHSLRGEGFDANEDGTGRGTPLVPVLPFDTTQVTSVANRSSPKPGDPCHPLAAGAHAPAIAIPIDMRQASRGATMTNNRAEGSSGGAPGTGIGQDGDPAPTVSTSHTPAIAFDCMASGMNGFGVGDVANPMRVGTNGAGSGHQAVAYSTKLHNTASNNAGKIFEERTACLDANSPPPALLTPMQVRRLTPRECERLQGFPDDYTAITVRGKAAADSPRYKALGNSWAVPCARWIGQRIQAVEAITNQQRRAA